MRAMVLVSARPMCAQVLPPSADLKTPMPAWELRKMLCSPVPTQTMFGSDGARAMSPTAAVAMFSKTGVQVVPSFSVFQTPPEAEAT